MLLWWFLHFPWGPPDTIATKISGMLTGPPQCICNAGSHRFVTRVKLSEDQLLSSVVFLCHVFLITPFVWIIAKHKIIDCDFQSYFSFMDRLQIYYFFPCCSPGFLNQLCKYFMLGKKQKESLFFLSLTWIIFFPSSSTWELFLH